MEAEFEITLLRTTVIGLVGSNSLVYAATVRKYSLAAGFWDLNFKMFIKLIVYIDFWTKRQLSTCFTTIDAI